jgi:nitrite reductase/ring-hydroxylating ferredoxin subunit
MNCSKGCSSCPRGRAPLSDSLILTAHDRTNGSAPLSRRAILRSGASGLLVVAFAGGCSADPLTEPGDGGRAGNVGGSAGQDGVAGTSGAAGVGAGGAGGSDGTAPSCSSSAISAGTASAVAVGALVMIGTGLVVGRDSGGLYAMSSVCTHQGCPTSIVGGASQPSLYCPCHGSMFSATGTVIRGPARRALQHYELDVSSSGSLTICVGSPVLSSARTPAP